jgi:hypothetical protein
VFWKHFFFHSDEWKASTTDGWDKRINLIKYNGW